MLSRIDGYPMCKDDADIITSSKLLREKRKIPQESAG